MKQRSDSASRGTTGRGRSRERSTAERSETEDAEDIVIRTEDAAEAEELERAALSFFPEAFAAQKPEEPAAADAYAALMRIASRNPPLTRERTIEMTRIVLQGWVKLTEESSKGRPDGEPEAVPTERPGFRRTKAGLAAREELARRNLRFVFLVVRRIRVGRAKPKLPFLDAIQEGWMGFLRALDKFDPDRGYSLLTYASWWIRQSVNRAEDDYGMIRVPVHMNEKLRRVFTKVGREGLPLEQALEATVRDYHEREEELRAKRDPAARPRPLAKDTLDRATERLLTASHVWRGVHSLDAPMNDEDDTTFLDGTADPESGLERYAERTDVSSVLTVLAIAVLALPVERERRIMIERLRERTLEEVGEDFGVTRERIRQIEHRAKQTLKRYLQFSDTDDLRRALLARAPLLSQDDLYMVLHGEHRVDARERALRAQVEAVAVGFRWLVAPSGAEPEIVERIRRSIAERRITRPETPEKPAVPRKKRMLVSPPAVETPAVDVIVTEPAPHVAPVPDVAPIPETARATAPVSARAARFEKRLKTRRESAGDAATIRNFLIDWETGTLVLTRRISPLVYDGLVEELGEFEAEKALAFLLEAGAVVRGQAPGQWRRAEAETGREPAVIAKTMARLERVRVLMHGVRLTLLQMERIVTESQSESVHRQHAELRQTLEWYERMHALGVRMLDRYRESGLLSNEVLDVLHAWTKEQIA